MSTLVVNEVRRGFYLDSVALMRLSARLCEIPGVAEAVLMIGTESNRRIMEDAGLLAGEGRGAGPNDLVIALRADGEDTAREALARAAAGLEGGLAGSGGTGLRPRSLAGALDALPDANLALVSTPGAFAAREARAALARGLNVMVFSDNVPLEDEQALKAEAARRGLLVMGPDCGTAYVAGTPLAFANVVPRGDVGIVAASGTGLQEVAVLLARLGAGVSHGIGVGGRDLGDAVGGLSTLAAIDLLAADDATRCIVLVSKPPGAATAAKVFERLAGCGKPAVACVFGLDAGAAPAGVTLAPTLKAAAEAAAGRTLPAEGFDPGAAAARLGASIGAARTSVRGLYSGGTLCTEAQAVLRGAGVAVSSNAPIDPAAAADSGNPILDLGADEHTLGRPHPMIEPSVRTPLLAAALADPACAVVLLDVVLGHGAHEDPAGAIVAALREAGDDRPCVVASVCGTEGDPQSRARQRAALEAAGAVIAPSNADAAALAAAVAVSRRG